MPLARLQAILGHNSLEVTQLYILEDEAQINRMFSEQQLSASGLPQPLQLLVEKGS